MSDSVNIHVCYFRIVYHLQLSCNWKIKQTNVKNMCSLTINISTHACVASMHFKNASLKQRNKSKTSLSKKGT